MYKYKAVYQNKYVEGFIKEENKEKALQSLKRQGFLVLSLEKVDTEKTLIRKNYAFLEIFTRDLIQLLEAGITLDKALVFIAESNKRYKTQLIKAAQELRRGSSLYEALLITGLFPSDYLELIKAGEESGKLIETLKLLYSFIYEMNRFKKQLLNSLIYPLFLINITFFSLAIFSMYIVPKFRLLFMGTDVELPFLTKLVFIISENLNTLIVSIMIFLSLILFLIYLSRRYRKLKKLLENLILKFPYIKDKLIEYDIIKISSSMYTLLKGGVTLDKALSITSELPSLEIVKNLLKLSLRKVYEGATLSSALASSSNRILPDVVIEIIKVGEESGELAGAWYQIYINTSEDFKNFIQKVIVMIEPTVILIMGLVIGLMIVGIVLGVYTVTAYV